MEKVSIITVCRNAESVIEKTILSVLSQDYSNIEYIIIDGGSIDGTVDIINKYGLKYISEPDNGIYDAMNKGLRLATGNWIAYMNAGDEYSSPTIIREIFGSETLEESRWPKCVKLIGGDVNLVSKGKKEKVKALDIREIFHKNIFCHQSTFTRIGEDAPCLKNKFGLPWAFNTRYRISADYDLFYDIADKYGVDSIKKIDITVADFDIEDSLSVRKKHKLFGEYLLIQSKHINILWFKECLKWIVNPFYPELVETIEGWRRLYQILKYNIKNSNK